MKENCFYDMCGLNKVKLMEVCMKGVKKILLLFLINFVLILPVEAYVCSFDKHGVSIEYDDAGTPSISQTKYEEVKTPIILNLLSNVESGKIKTTNKLDLLEKEYIGTCPKSLYVCTYEYEGYFNFGLGVQDIVTDDRKGLLYAGKKEIYLFSSEKEMEKNSKLKDLKNGVRYEKHEAYDNYEVGYKAIVDTFGCDGEISFCEGVGFVSGIVTGVLGTGGSVITESHTFKYYEEKNCETSQYTGDLMTFNLACPNLQSYKNKFNDSIGEYKNCSNDLVCKSKAITNINEKEELIKSYCKSILAEQNFDGGSEQECLLDCLDIGVQTKKAKVAAGIISGDSGECGFSGRLLVWISNILRWIKYILPVIVIVMGIIDFIKAIAADKEDEMKKAQGAFVKRLIAAALVFIIPLIIEFILDKMGFGYNDCGIFNK